MMENKIVTPQFAPYFEKTPEEVFSVIIGGTVYDVTTHFNPDGRQSVLEQFKELLLDSGFQPHI